MNNFFFPKTILITGATGGLGSALAQAYAIPGSTLILQGRDENRLEGIKKICESHGAYVITRSLDLRNTEELDNWLKEVCQQQEVDLLIANAGVNTNIRPNGSGEPWEETKALIEINVLATMATVHGVLPFMRARKRGQIALISSLAAHFGLPVTPSYCASKAAIKVYGEALRGWLEPEGIRINVVMPGYVESQMCRDMPGPKPFLWCAEKAGHYIKRGLERNKPRISFPFPLNLGTWLLSILPQWISIKILQKRFVSKQSSQG